MTQATENHLIVFAKYPKLGEVKTRLAEEIGEERALRVYQALLDHTLHVATPPKPETGTALHTNRMEWTTHWFWNRIPNGFDKYFSEFTLPESFIIHEQISGDLGAVMHQAFRTVAKWAVTHNTYSPEDRASAATLADLPDDHGFREKPRIVIIGSDCLEMHSGILSEAFQSLHTHDVCIGPAVDGGYYLLGMKDLEEDLFRGIPWSTDAVYRLTLEKFTRHSLTYFSLPVLRDIDRAEDFRLSRRGFEKKMVL